MSGTPISLLKLASAATVRVPRPADRGQDVLRRRLAGGTGDPDDASAAAVADDAAERCERGEAVVRDERRGGAPLERVFDEGRARVVHCDEQVAGGDAARVDLDACHSLRILGEDEPAEAKVGDLVDGQRDHARAPSRRSASRATERSSNGTVTPCDSWPCS